MLAMILPFLAFAGELDGVWRQDCRAGYSREEAFAGAHAAYTERNFRDSACSSLSVETISRGSISLGELVLEPSGARALDFSFESVSLRPIDEKVATLWRERGVCGFRDWRAGVEKEVTGRYCDFFGLGSVVRVPSPGDRKFGIVVPGEGAIFLGRLSPERDGSTPERRPRELDSEPYRKVP